MPSDDREIDGKLRSLELELQQMKQRTTEALVNSSNDRPASAATDHAELISELIDRTPAPRRAPSSDKSGSEVYKRPIERATDDFGDEYMLSSLREQELRMELQQQERRLSELGQQVALERSFAAQERAKRERAEGENVDSRRRISELEAEILGIRTAADAQQVEFRMQLAESNAHLESLEISLTETRANSAQISLARKTAEQQATLALSAKAEAERRLQGIESQLRQRQSENADLQLQLAQAGEEKSSADRVARQNAALQTQVSEADRMRQDAEAAVLRLRGQLAELQRQRKEEAMELQRLAAEADSHKAAAEQARQEAFGASSESERLRGTLHACTSDAKQLRVIVDQQRGELRRQADAIAGLQAENRTMVRLQHDTLMAGIGDSRPRLSNNTWDRYETGFSEDYYSPRALGAYTSQALVAPKQSDEERERPVPTERPQSVEEDYQRPAAALAAAAIARQNAGGGVAKALNGNSTTEDQDLEKELLELNIERGGIEAWLSKLPVNSNGRTVAERKDKQIKEYRLSCIDAKITTIKNSLRKRRLI